QLDGNLLGGVTLRDVISAVLSPTGTIHDQLPKLVTTQLPDAIDTSFDWHPRVKPINDPNDPQSNSDIPIVTTGGPDGTQLGIGARLHAPLDGGAPAFTVDGTLTNFRINFAGIISLLFDELRFHAQQGKKVDLTLHGIHVTFINELAFVNQLADILPANGFEDPPSLEVTPEGVTAGYTLGIPAAGVGVMSLENIALSAQLSVPFDNRPAGVRLGFSERHHPFLVSVSFIGGGGFLAVGVNTHGIDQLEAALELGGNITIGLGIVEANVHAMAGFYFGFKQLPGGGAQLDFSAYVRIGGSVDLLGIVSVSIELYLGLELNPTTNVLAGDASVTVGVHVLFVDKSFTLSVHKEFAMPAATHLARQD